MLSVFWIEMLDQHKGHAAARRQASEQLPECVEAVCGGSESNDGEIDTRVPWKRVLVRLRPGLAGLSRPSCCHCRGFRESGFHEGNACDPIPSYHKRCTGKTQAGS
jgi:hypothetical protein